LRFFNGKKKKTVLYRSTSGVNRGGRSNGVLARTPTCEDNGDLNKAAEMSVQGKGG